MSAEQRFRRNLDWNLIKVFHEIVEVGGVSHAARSLSRQQPSVSLALQRLESHLGARLCQRGPGGFTLTAEGEAVAELCDRVAKLVTLLPQRVAASDAELRGRVRVRLISSLSTPALDEALHHFHARFPCVEIATSIGSWEDLPDLLLRGELDVGIGPVRFQHASLSHDLLFKETQRVYCGPDHPFYGRTSVNLRELATQGFALKAPGEPEEVMRFRLRHGLGQVVVATADHIDEMRRLVRLGIGLGFLPVGTVEDDLANGRLWCLTPDWRDPSIPMYVVSNPSAPPYRARDLLLSSLRATSEKH
ncbi:LysR family transcriptional regulator [Rhodospirillaceae bacterium SYSU D60014]|uniref:LysR family transcriptional regulator n=1 Tax=Virgifigura deserti TaxID=2268457 RepID=UPI0013C4AE0B